MLTNTDAADRYRAAAETQLSQITAAIPTPTPNCAPACFAQSSTA
jgi:hypothetical protein